MTHSVVLRKRTEALFGVVTFHGFAVAGDDGERFFVPAVKAAMRPKKALESRRIEFVGDSISCGYGIEGHPPCPFTAATENSGLYAPRHTTHAHTARPHTHTPHDRTTARTH